MIWLFDGFKRKYNSSSFSNAFKGKYPRVSMMQWSGTEHRKLLPCQSVIHLWNWHFWSEINDQHKIYALISNLMRNWCPISGKHFWIFILFPDTHSVSHVQIKKTCGLVYTLKNYKKIRFSRKAQGLGGFRG